MNRLSFLPFLMLLLCLCCAKSAYAVNSADLLLPDQAFQLTAKAKQKDRLLLSWNIAEGYYLYRNKFKFISMTSGIAIAEPAFEAGKIKKDKFFGEVEIYRNHVEIEIPVQYKDPNVNQLTLEVTFQGCAEAGVCYMPVRQTVSLDLSDSTFDWWGLTSTTNNLKPFISKQDSIAASFKGNSMWLVMLSFLGFGLLLAFTPCIFPMIPILSGIIVGQGKGISTFKAFSLSLSYVLASAVTYTFFGVLAGLFGSNLQIFFQQPAVIIGFSAIFFLLALSMFGFFHVQIPAFLQTRIMALGFKQQGGNLLGAAIMGMLSALAIGPCVTAPLAGALIYIGQSGDAILGGLALFFLGLGMGLPLLVIGTSAGKLLPKTGRWMNFTKAVFGVGLLAVAVWLLGRILPPAFSLLLWGALLFVPVIYLGWNRFWKSAVLVAVTYAVTLTVGIFTHQQRDYMQLLCVAAVACEKQAALPFQKISSTDELRQALIAAHDNNQWVMLDVYADWCVACQEMEHYTFANDRVRNALAGFLLVQADVTDNRQAHQVMLKQLELVGPPAILFFGPDQLERKALRVIGYMDSENFLTQLDRVFH